MQLPMLGARRSWTNSVFFWRRPSDPYKRWRQRGTGKGQGLDGEVTGTAGFAYYTDLADGSVA